MYLNLVNFWFGNLLADGHFKDSSINRGHFKSFKYFFLKSFNETFKYLCNSLIFLYFPSIQFYWCSLYAFINKIHFEKLAVLTFVIRVCLSEHSDQNTKNKKNFTCIIPRKTAKKTPQMYWMLPLSVCLSVCHQRHKDMCCIKTR